MLSQGYSNYLIVSIGKYKQPICIQLLPIKLELEIVQNSHEILIWDNRWNI